MCMVGITMLRLRYGLPVAFVTRLRRKLLYRPNSVLGRPL